MAPKKRDDIFNVNAIAERLEGKNTKQKVTTLFMGANVYAKNEDIDAIVEIILAQAKEKAKYLKSLKHK